MKRDTWKDMKRHGKIKRRKSAYQHICRAQAVHAGIELPSYSPTESCASLPRQ